MLNTIVLIIPVLFVVVFIEWYISYRHDRNTYTPGNFAMNVTIGAMDQVFSLVYFTVLFFALHFSYSHFHLYSLGKQWYIWVIAYIAIDFLSYWYHRFSHRINILWAGHVTHHSSEHFNFSNGFRTSFFQGVNRILFWSILPVFGFDPLMLLIILKVSGLYDFLLHTEYIPKLGWIEKILITPSQHRVHHGRNDIYLDKNYGSTFVIWDKMFGTYQEETEKVEYGIKGTYIDDNPYRAIGYYYTYLWRVMRMKETFIEKINVLFLPPDRTPKPELEIKANFTREEISPRMKSYAYFLLIAIVPAMILMLLYKDFLRTWEFILYAAIGISSVSTSAFILNGNIGRTFHKVEFYRLWISIFTILILYVKRQEWHILAVVLLLMICTTVYTFLKIRNDHAAINGKEIPSRLRYRR
jgi:alkylglycerol monooxygenase